jgi:serine protease Do
MRRTNTRIAAIGAVVLGLAAPFVLAVPTMAQEGPASVAALAARLSDAVVNISTTTRVAGAAQFPEVPPGSPLEDFFNEANPNNGLGDDAMREASSLGSGFIISADGLVVTNNHVIDGASEILVYLTDGTRLTAEVKGVDLKTDLAVLKVDAGRPLTFVEFADSDTADVGDWVMAIGNPFGFGGSVTLGIVSARNRELQSGPYDSFIQTDASINQGNSGGPLFDMEGKVVGINTAIIARGGSSLGIGFAMPANQARIVVSQLSEFGETRRGWLGVGIQDVTSDIALSLGRNDTHGALVVEVTPDGPAEGALNEGDIILQIDGKKVTRMRDLPRIVAETQVGTEVAVTVLRGGAEQSVGVTLGRLEDGEQRPVIQVIDVTAPAAELPGEEVADAGLPSVMGFEVSELTDALRLQYGIPADVNGPVITTVNRESDAFEKGLSEGLVITEINQQRVTSVADVNSKVGAANEQGRPALLFKVTDATGTSRFVAVRPL